MARVDQLEVNMTGSWRREPGTGKLAWVAAASQSALMPASRVA